MDAGTEVLDTLEWSAHDAPPELIDGVVIRQRVSECRIIYRE